MDIEYGNFIWDKTREAENIRKHGIHFQEAAHAFLDPQRKVFTDSRHSETEARFFCIGQVGSRILTVRFVYRDQKIRIFGAGYWRKGKKYYEQK